MAEKPELLNPVALAADLPKAGLVRGRVGTVVEILGDDTFEVEFSDENGKTYAQLPLNPDQLIVLHHHPIKVA